MSALQQSVSGEVNSAAEFVVHNSSLQPLINTSYQLEDIDKILSELENSRTLSITRLPNGGSTAVTITDTLSLASALGDNLINAWDRDSILQAIAEQAVAADEHLSERLSIQRDAWKRGLLWSLWHHCINQERFIRILSGEAPADGMNYPAVRVNPVTGQVPAGPWNHKQHDALGFILHLLFWQLNHQGLSWEDEALKSLAVPYATLLIKLFEKVSVWSEPDDSAWEFGNSGLHLSSLGIVVLALEELLEFLSTHGTLKYLTYEVTSADVASMIEKCKQSLQTIGSRESVWSGGSRDCDLAQLNALLLQAVSNRVLFSEQQVEEILLRIESSLVGKHGVRRFAGDVWNGRTNNATTAPGEEAQWTIGAPAISVIYGWLFRVTNQPKYLERQAAYFSRTLAGVDADWRLPEAYILDKGQMVWVPDENKPLAWAQSMVILALAAMRSSLKVKEDKVSDEATITAEVA